jgi:hypothetical protein
MESRLYYSPLAEVVVADSVAVALAEALSAEVVLVAEALEADSKLGFKHFKLRKLTSVISQTKSEPI